VNLEFYSIDELSPNFLQEITVFLDSQESSHIFQFPQWSDSSAKYVLYRERDNIRWFSAFGIHSPIGRAWPWMRAVVVNHGPVCDDENLWQVATGEFAARLARDDYSYLDVSPDCLRADSKNLEDRFTGLAWRRIGAERFSLRLDLTDSEDAIFGRFRKNSRYEVRHAERLGVSVAPAISTREIEEFLRLHSCLSVRRGFPAASPEHTRAAVSWLIDDKRRGALLLARANDTVRGGAVIARCGRRCSYLLGATDNHDRYNVGHILQWNALLWAKAHGCDEYDFGGYTPGAKTGPAWFKAGFGGKLVRFASPYRRILRPGYYRVFQLASHLRNRRKARAHAESTVNEPLASLAANCEPGAATKINRESELQC
jgi:hypothetical protein